MYVSFLFVNGFCICLTKLFVSGCLGDFQVISGDGPLPMAIFELLEYIVNEVTAHSRLYYIHAAKICVLNELPPLLL